MAAASCQWHFGTCQWQLLAASGNLGPASGNWGHLHTSWSTSGVYILHSYTLEHKWHSYPSSIHLRAQVAYPSFMNISWSTSSIIYPFFLYLGAQVGYISFLHIHWSTSGISILPSYTLEHKWHSYPSFMHLGRGLVSLPVSQSTQGSVENNLWLIDGRGRIPS